MAQATNRPCFIGIYGISGSGKSHLMNRLKTALGDQQFAFYEGSAQIAELVPGGLESLDELTELEKHIWRVRAIENIDSQYAKDQKIPIVAGHYMLWSAEQPVGSVIATTKDMVTYSHIMYLDVPPQEIVKRRIGDEEKVRPIDSEDHLRKWQMTEKDLLREVCRNRGVLFSVLSDYLSNDELLTRALKLILDTQAHNEQLNLCHIRGILDVQINTSTKSLDTILVLDADKTLAPDDTGETFWEELHKTRGLEGEECPLRKIFDKDHLGYSYTAFRQAMLAYEEACNDVEFDQICTLVASSVTIYPEILHLLHLAAAHDRVGIVVASCGLRLLWKKVIDRYDLSHSVIIIAGGRTSDEVVVTPEIKGEMVNHLRIFHKLRVCAFGDGPLDIDMLCAAHEAIVVVGDECTRSRSMDDRLMKRIDKGGFRPRQVLMPGESSPRLNLTILPTIRLTDPEIIDFLLNRRRLPVTDASDKSASKLLATDMRNANLSGPLLRKAHMQAGHYLAMEFISERIGIEECPIVHVLGVQTSGHRLLHEQRTLIIALMRGGEPMALGVNEAFPTAMFLHANEPADVTEDHLKDVVNIILVDSVINSGKTILDFVWQIRKLHDTVRIVVVAGVVHDQAVAETLDPILGNVYGVELVALRFSATKFTGTKGTDTGNRLFNTTHLK